MADPSNGPAFPQATTLPQAAPTGLREFSPSTLAGAFILTAVLATLSCALMFKIEPRRLDVCRTMVFQVFTKLPLVLAQIGYAKFLVPLDSVALFWLFGGILAFALRNVQSPPRRLGQIPSHGTLSIITFSFWSDVFYMGPSIQYESAIIAQRVARGLRTSKLTWKQTNRCVHKSTIYYAAKIMLPRSVQLLFRPVIQHLADLQVLPEWIPEPKLEPLHLLCEAILLSVAFYPELAALIQRSDLLMKIYRAIGAAALVKSPTIHRIHWSMSLCAWLYLSFLSNGGRSNLFALWSLISKVGTMLTDCAHSIIILHTMLTDLRTIM